MVFRRWNPGAPDTVVLFHGGSGSWTHWIRNIEALSARFEVIAPDLPGLGDSAALPAGYTAEDAAHWVRRGLAEMLGDRSFQLVAFSWGCTVAALIASAFGSRLASLMLVGPAAMGPMPMPTRMRPLLRRNPDMTEDEVFETNRENLARLMIHDRSRIDDLAVLLQTENTNRSRFNSPRFARSTRVLDGLRGTRMPLRVVYGEYDAPAHPNFGPREDKLREIRPDVVFDVIPDGGHWLQYELADTFNAMCLDWLSRHAG